MPRPLTLRMPTKRRERPLKAPLVALAVVGLALGILLARSTLDENREAAAESRETTRVSNPAPEAEPPSTRPTTVTPQVSIERGRVAYLRCEGAHLEDGQYPCPRDRDFEREAWRAIGTLPRCPAAPHEAGSVDLRYEIVRGERGNVRVAHAPSDLARTQLEECIGGALASLTPRLNARRLIVSFEFDLETMP